MGADAGDMVFVIADQRRTVNHILGLLRLELARPPVGEGGLNFLWITEFPLFESVTDSGEPIPAHHPSLCRILMILRCWILPQVQNIYQFDLKPMTLFLTDGN